MVNEKKDFNNSYDDEDKINNEIRNYLNLHGVHVSNEAIDDLENMCASGYREIPCSYIGQINMIFQQLPGLATHAISHHGTYRVYFDKGLGVLQQAKQGNGFLRANIVRAGTNNDITGQALLKAASKGPLIANSVFFALSMVTGQYFLTEINNKLSQIDSIQQFYENEKQSKLFANYHDLQQVIQTFEFMNTNQKLATIQRLQQIRHDSYADLISYSNTFEKQKVELTGLKINTKKNIQKTSDIINKIGKIILSYKFALYTYFLAHYLEIILSGNMNSSYIDKVKEDIKLETENYKKLVARFSFEIRKINKFRSNLDFLLFISELLKECFECSPFEQLKKELTNYNQVINKSKVELVCIDDKAYIKFSDIAPKEKVVSSKVKNDETI